MFSEIGYDQLGLLGGAGIVIAFLFRALITSKDKELASMVLAKDAVIFEKERAINEIRSLKESWEKIAHEFADSAVRTTDFFRGQQNKPPLATLMVAPVIPEKNSPSSQLQIEEARLQTLKALMELVRKESGQEPRSN